MVAASETSSTQRNIPAYPELVPNLIGGKSSIGRGERLPVFDPSIGEQVAELAEADERTVSAAVDTARKTFVSGVWSKATVAERQQVLYQCAAIIRDHLEELAQLETLCAGIPIDTSSRRYVGFGAGWLQYFGERIGSWSGSAHRQTPGVTTLVVYEPRGVAAQFSPWNMPIGIALLKVAAAISVGNSVVLKPSEQAPIAVWRMIELLHEAGLPPGVVNLVNGRGHVTGAALASSDNIDCTSFTGGGVAGRAVAKAAASRFLPCVLELGGKSAFVIFDDADLDTALEAALWSVYGNNGEACLAGSRILVQSSVHDDFIERFVERVKQIRVGDPFDPSMDMGPMASEKHMEHVLGFVDRAAADKDAILYGGGRRKDLGAGYFVDPIVARCTDPGHVIAQEEIFGPFATFFRFDSEEDAFRMANATRYGLVAYLWTRDHQRVLRGYQALRAGTVLINSAMVTELNAPFGGVGESGVGRECGDYSLRFYSQAKTVVMAHDWKPRRPMGGG